MPKSHTIHDPHVGMTVLDIQKLMQIKIQERTGKGAHEIRAAYELFGRPASGITFDMLKRNLHKFGLDLHDEDLRKFFNHFDVDGSGIIDFYEFVEIVLPCDYPITKSKMGTSSRLWDSLPQNGERPKMDSLKEITKQMNGVPNNKGWSPFCDAVPESIRSFKWTNEYVEGLLRKKINERGLSSKDLLQQAYFLFGRPKHGLTLSTFGQVLKTKLGLPVSPEQCKELFKKYDTSGDGRIDFYEFIEKIMPDDYPVNSPFANWQHGEKDGLFGEKGNPQLRGMGNNMIPLSMVHMSKGHQVMETEHEYTDEEIIELLQVKILERGSSSKDLLKRSYFLFGTAGGGISQSRFRQVLGKFGMSLSEERVARLFKRFDSDGCGHVDFNEFVRGIMPEDYPGQKKDAGLGVQSLSPHANAVAPKANIYLIGGEAKHLNSMEGRAILSKQKSKMNKGSMRERPRTAGSSRPSTSRSMSFFPPHERPDTASSVRLPGTGMSGVAQQRLKSIDRQKRNSSRGQRRGPRAGMNKSLKGSRNFSGSPAMKKSVSQPYLTNSDGGFKETWR